MAANKRKTTAYISPQELITSPETRPIISKRLRRQPIKHQLPLITSPTLIPEELSCPFLVQAGSPWENYTPILTFLDLGGESLIARKKNDTARVIVKRFIRSEGSEIAKQFRRLCHPSILQAIEAFTTSDYLYIILEEMHLTLRHIVKSPVNPRANQIAVIVGQIVDGLSFLEQKQLAYGELTCDTILIHSSGSVKLANYELFVSLRDSSGNNHFKGLSTITLLLMQKYTLGTDKIIVEDPSPWANSEILSFLPFIADSSTLHALRQHPFLSSNWLREKRWDTQILSDLVFIAQHSVQREYQYKGNKVQGTILRSISNQWSS